MQGRLKFAVLWIALIVLFVGLYSQLNTGAIDIFASWLPIVGGLIFLAVVGMGWLKTRRPWVRMSKAALQMFNQGLYGKAVELWAAAARDRPDEVSLRISLATGRLYLWQIRKAQAELNALDQILSRRRETVAPAYRLGLLGQRALVAALANRLHDARGYLLEIKEPTAISALARAVLELREGDVEKAASLLRGPLVDQLGGPLARLARALEAWCAGQQHGAVRHVDKAGLFAEAAQDDMREAWPEFMTFLDGAPQA